MDFDDVLNWYGGNGRAHYILTVQTVIAQMLTCFYVMLHIFDKGDDNYRCLVPSCEERNDTFHADWLNWTTPLAYDRKTETMVFDKCYTYKYIENSPQYSQCRPDNFDKNIIVPCEEFVYKSPYASLRSEWTLTCERSYFLPLSMSVFLSGFLFGSYVFGILSDRYGRKRVIMMSSYLLIASNTVIIFSTNIWMYITLRFFIATSSVTLSSNLFVLVSELCGPKNKRIMAIIGFGGRLGDYFILLAAYFFRDWKELHIVLAIPSLLMFFNHWLTFESPKWLISQQKYDAAKTEMLKFAKLQGKSFPDELITVKTIDDNNAVKKSFSPIDFFKTPVMCRRIILICIIWFLGSLTSYAIALGAPDMVGNLYVNFAWLSAGDLLGSIFMFVTIKRAKRKLMIGLASLALAIISYSYLAIPPGSVHVIQSMTMFGRFAINIIQSMAYIYTAELFPTTHRSSAIGTGSSFSKLGSIVAPYVNTLIYVWRPLPQVILGSCGVIGLVVLVFLPETLNKDLPGSVADIEEQKDQQIQEKYTKIPE